MPVQSLSNDTNKSFRSEHACEIRTRHVSLGQHVSIFDVIADRGTLSVTKTPGIRSPNVEV